jgi:hypothetical protein
VWSKVTVQEPLAQTAAGLTLTAEAGVATSTPITVASDVAAANSARTLLLLVDFMHEM